MKGFLFTVRFLFAYAGQKENTFSKDKRMRLIALCVRHTKNTVIQIMLYINKAKGYKRAFICFLTGKLNRNVQKAMQVDFCR